MRLKTRVSQENDLALVAVHPERVVDVLNPRELEMGAMAMAMLAWMISEEGLD